MGIRLNDGCHSALVEVGCISCRILRIKFKFSRVKVCEVVGYGPSEGDVGERNRFWSDIDRILDRVENGYRLCILEDLNGWIEERRESEGLNGGNS